MAEQQEHRRRRQRPGGHRPPRPRPAVPGRARRHQERHASPPIDGPEGRRSVEIILAIYKAAETGKAVKLPLAQRPGAEGPQDQGRGQGGSKKSKKPLSRRERAGEGASGGKEGAASGLLGIALT